MGLIDKVMPPTADAPMQKGAPEGEAGESDFSPAQQKALDKFSLACQHALYGGSGMDQKLADALEAAADDAKAMADFAYGLTAMLDEKSGGMLDDELLAAAGAEVLSQVVEVAQATGAKVGPKEISKASQLMMGRFLAESGASPEDVQKMDAAGDAAIAEAGGQQPAPTQAPPPGGIIQPAMGA